ncbi:MAG: hypothetical protein GY757_54245, partial [bacterium]|nr:hypothetical protein [bacterium]
MKRKIINILTGIMYGAILLSAIVGAILVINFTRLEIEKPLENQALENLKTVLEDNPDNEQILKGYRDLHLLSRGVFFTSVYQMETGRNILLTSLVIFFLSIQLINLLENNKVRDPKLSGKKRIHNRTAGFYGIVFSGLFLAGAGIIFSY